jgi:hypothetical protein
MRKIGKRSKKIVCLLLICFCFLFAGCGGSQDDQVEESEYSSDVNKDTEADKTEVSGNEEEEVKEEAKESVTESESESSTTEASTTEKTQVDADVKSTQTASDSTTEKSTAASKKASCTISINCKTILQNMDQLAVEKKDFVPSNGIILKKTKVTLKDGDSVHDILQRVCKSKKIQMESSYSPAYQSAYVEGINQLYEFDCGQESGWTYRVNGQFPNYGAGSYEVKDGDVIEWLYTCNLGKDVGNSAK